MIKKHMVRVDVESDLWLPEWVFKKTAAERVKILMDKQRASGTPLDSVKAMRPEQKVPGVLVVEPQGRHRDYLIIPSLGELEASEVTYIAGMIREGGYGKGPRHQIDDVKARWRQIVGDTVDYLVEKRKRKQAGRNLCLTV